MNTPEQNERNRKWMKAWRAKHRKRPKKYPYGKDKCPKCGIKLDQEFEYWHKSCAYYQEIHAKVAIEED